MSSESDKANDRRKEDRVERRIKLRFRSGDGRWKSGFTRDLSIGGMFVTAKALPETSEVELKLAHNRQEVVLEGKVIRTHDAGKLAGFALQFSEPSQAWIDLCRILRQGLDRRRRTTELAVPSEDTE